MVVYYVLFFSMVAKNAYDEQWCYCCVCLETGVGRVAAAVRNGITYFKFKISGYMSVPVEEEEEIVN